MSLAKRLCVPDSSAVQRGQVRIVRLELFFLSIPTMVTMCYDCLNPCAARVSNPIASVRCVWSLSVHHNCNFAPCCMCVLRRWLFSEREPPCTLHFIDLVFILALNYRGSELGPPRSRITVSSKKNSRRRHGRRLYKAAEDTVCLGSFSLRAENFFPMNEVHLLALWPFSRKRRLLPR